METSLFDSKQATGPSLLPSSQAPVPLLKTRSTFARKLLVSLGIIIYGAYIWRCTHANGLNLGQLKQDGEGEARCAQSDVLIPEKNGDLWRSLSVTFGTEDFKKRAVDWLGGAVRVPTESYDDLGHLDEDPRWDAFGPFHDYLLDVFPRVHETLKLTKVNTYGLLYVWEGSDSLLKPLVLAAHQDVVPVNPTTVDQWTHPPYSGYFDGERIWGRGSSDDKSGLIGALSGVESLIEGGFKPTRTVVLAFGFDEEVSGRQGAQKLVEVLLDRYGKNGVALVVDEGGGFGENYGSVVAVPGIGEKGYTDTRVEVNTPGGHSSVPPKHTSIGILAALLVEYEAHPFKLELSRRDPFYSTLQCVAEHGKDLPESLRKTIKRSWSSNKALLTLEKEISKNPVYKALVETTQAIDIVQGGVKANALPEQAWALINHRVSVISSVGETQAHDAKIIEGLAEKFNLTFNAFGTKLSKEAFGAPSSGSLTLSDAHPGTALEPAPITPTLGKEATPYKLLSGTIKATYNSHRDLTGANEIVVSPGMMSGNTDTRYYWDLSKHIFRYSHINAGSGTGLGNVHTVDESLGINEFVEMIRFFATLILNADEATDL
ncbi:hypothetical protein DXG03_009397 [Asterophora parasitica]|uniref:Peptidase M20 dimerisation domain-containing protein n=1 Tax=Asterophora parasitica TaxID=117018 RepID=A0A9P7GCR0_9AGAR|nr:hypothetical protein DXG03_009397 [Asterophora parasitica]